MNLRLFRIKDEPANAAPSRKSTRRWMRVLVCGGRSYGNVTHAAQVLGKLHREHRIDVVIQGGAPGADLKRHALKEGPNIIDRPIIIVHALDGGRQQYILHLEELDKFMQDPAPYGILLSDLVDHIAAAYNRTTGRDERDIRDRIMKVMRDENRFKERDPKRANLIGATIVPKAN